jgi:hypothetical protein
MKDPAYLFGPFIGELSWELLHFSPFAIFKKNQDPRIKMIVFTRPERFDLYGRWVDIFVPLKIANEKYLYKQNGFGLDSFKSETFKLLCMYFKEKYKEKYKIKDMFYPDISGFRRKIKWQFLRDNMLYDFKPRRDNFLELQKLFQFDQNLVFVDLDFINTVENYNYVFKKDLIINHDKTTYIGILIELIKRCKFIVSNFSSIAFKISLLLNIPVIACNENTDDDLIHLINPFNTPVIKCHCIEDGIKIYENSFRS